MVAHFADDAQLVDVLGRVHVGLNAIARVFRHNFATIHRGSRTHYDVDDVELLAKKTAVVRARSTLWAPEAPLAGSSEATLTIVLREHQEGWTILRFHATFVRELDSGARGATSE